MKPPRDMGGEELKLAARAADKRLGYEIDRVAVRDPEFRAVLERALTIEAEVERRRNGR